MKKEEFISKIAEKTGYTKTDIRVALTAIQEITYDALKEGDDVPVMDGVKLVRHYQEPKNGFNVITNQHVVFPGKYVPRAKFGIRVKRLFADQEVPTP